MSFEDGDDAPFKPLALLNLLMIDEELGPSALFQAYKLIKSQENKGTDRNEIGQMLMEKFGEKNPEASVQQ